MCAQCGQNRNKTETVELSHILTETMYSLDIVESDSTAVNVYIHNKTLSMDN
jgi:hypothetical protein